MQIKTQARPRSRSADPETVEDFLIAAALHQLYKIRYYVERLRLHPDATKDGKPTALCYAALKPYPPLISYYLANGADANVRDAMSMTPLHYAAIGGCSVCIATLVQAGARLNQPNHRGETPLAVALSRSASRDCAELLRRYGASTSGDAAAPQTFH